MRRVSVFSLQTGMKVGCTVNSSMGEVLLKKGVTLTAGYIKRIIEMGIPFLYIEDGLLGDFSAEDVVALETRMAAVQQVKNILLNTKESGKLVIEPTSIYGTVGGLTNNLLSNRSLMFNLIDLRAQDDYTFAHSVNVCVLSLMTGITLGYNAEQLATLGVGALLHDLGKVKIPETLLNKPAPLTAKEYDMMKKHTFFGYELISSAKELSYEHAAIALQHHECLDGSGYPSGVSGDGILEYAQIVAIADKFDALTANRIYRKAYPPHEAYEMCAGSGNYLFKDSVVKAFLHNIAAYPTGTMVELTNGKLGVVLDTPKGYSRFPRVRILFDQKRRPLKIRGDVSLTEQVGLFVVRVLEDGEIGPLLPLLRQ